LPEGGENKIHFDENGTEGEDAAEEDVDPEFLVWAFDGDSFGNGGVTAGEVRFSAHVSTDNGTAKCYWKSNKKPKK